MRAVGSAVFCEPCLAAKLAAAGAVPAAGAYSYSDPASGVNVSGTAAGGGTYTYSDPASGIYTSGVIPPQPPMGSPNPLLAGFLGFIPGVGAMYNEQYAKGLVHLIVFAILVSLADSNGIFGLFVAGWEFYMAIEAHHTARARRDGLPLPNPFGLNDLAEKMGFGKAWGAGTSAPTSGAVPAASPYTDPYGKPAAGAPAPGAAYAPPFTPPVAPPYASGAVPPNWGAPPPPAWEQYPPPIPPVPLDSQVPYPGNRFPAGALWLIGLGALFLVANAGLFRGFSNKLFLPVLLIGLAVFIFVRKMTSYGGGLRADGSPDYHLRVFRALRGSVWLALVGLLFFLDAYGILTWGHSWPLFIILAGVMTVLQRAAYSSAAAATPPYYPGYGYPAQPQDPPPATPAPAASTEIITTKTHDQEGS